MIGTVAWFKKWIAPLAAVAIGAGSLAGAIWYRTNVPVVVARGAERVVTETATTTATKEVAAAPVVVTAPPRTETVVRTVEAAAKTLEAPPRDRETPEQRETVTETVTETERPVLQVDMTREKDKHGKSSNATP